MRAMYKVSMPITFSFELDENASWLDIEKVLEQKIQQGDFDCDVSYYEILKKIPLKHKITQKEFLEQFRR